MQTLGIVMVVMFGLVAICLFFHFVAYTIPGWIPQEIPAARNRNANRTRTRNATTADGIIAPARAHVLADGHGPLPRLPAGTTLPRTASSFTVANGITGATSRPDGSVGIQLAIVPQFVRINGNGGGNSGGNSGGTARPVVPRVAGRVPSRRAAPPEYDVEAGLADPPPRYSEGLGEHDSQTVIARAA